MTPDEPVTRPAASAGRPTGLVTVTPTTLPVPALVPLVLAIGTVGRPLVKTPAPGKVRVAPRVATTAVSPPVGLVHPVTRPGRPVPVRPQTVAPTPRLGRVEETAVDAPRPGLARPPAATTPSDDAGLPAETALLDIPLATPARPVGPGPVVIRGLPVIVVLGGVDLAGVRPEPVVAGRPLDGQGETLLAAPPEEAVPVDARPPGLAAHVADPLAIAAAVVPAVVGVPDPTVPGLDETRRATGLAREDALARVRPDLVSPARLRLDLREAVANALRWRKLLPPIFRGRGSLDRAVSALTPSIFPKGRLCRSRSHSRSIASNSLFFPDRRSSSAFF